MARTGRRDRDRQQLEDRRLRGRGDARIVAEEAFASLVAAPAPAGDARVPVPTSPALAQLAYPRARDIVALAGEVLDARDRVALLEPLPDPAHLDQPDPSFVGPF